MKLSNIGLSAIRSSCVSRKQECLCLDVTVNFASARVFPTRPFPSFQFLVFQSEAKAIGIKMIFYSHANKTYFHKKVMHLALFWMWEFLELGNGLYSQGLSCLYQIPAFQTIIKAGWRAPMMIHLWFTHRRFLLIVLSKTHCNLIYLVYNIPVNWIL